MERYPSPMRVGSIMVIDRFQDYWMLAVLLEEPGGSPEDDRDRWMLRALKAEAMFRALLANIKMEYASQRPCQGPSRDGG